MAKKPGQPPSPLRAPKANNTRKDLFAFLPIAKMDTDRYQVLMGIYEDISPDIERISSNTGVSFISLAKFLFANATNNDARAALLTCLGGQVLPDELIQETMAQIRAEKSAARKPVARKVYPERTIKRLVDRYKAAAAEFTNLPFAGTEQMIAGNTIINSFVALQKRGFPVDELPHQDALRRARALQRAQARANAKAAAG